VTSVGLYPEAYGASGPSDLIRAVNEIRNHADHYRLAEAYYRGEVGEIFTSAAVQRLLREKVNAFNPNLACRVIDAVLDRVEIASISAGEDDALSQQVRDQVWNANRMGRYSKLVHRTSLVCGDSYLNVWPAEDEDLQGVQIHFNSPVTTRVFYNAEDPKKKDFAAKTWVEGSRDRVVTRVTLYYADRVERWASKPGSKGDQMADFEPYGEDGEQWPIPNPFGEIPVFHFRTDEPYGRPEHRNAWGPQNAINKITATQMSNVDFSGAPQRYLISEALSSMDGAQAAVDWDDSVNPMDRKSNLSAGPGLVWNLPDSVKSVGELKPTDPKNFLEPIGQQVRLMAASTGTPLRFFDPTGQVPSGEALRADEAPLTARISDREEWWEETWNDALVFASRVAGIPVTSLDIQWAPVHVVDDQEGLSAALLKVQLGVPLDQVLTELGYLASLVAQWDQEGRLTPTAPSTADQAVSAPAKSNNVTT
jgi:hypothetical protein